MVRKIKEEVQVICEGIFDVVQVCFYEYGVVGISLVMIGVWVGFICGVVYWYFKNKIEVLMVMIDCECILFIECLCCMIFFKCFIFVLDLCLVLLVFFQELVDDECLCNMMEIMLCNDLLVESQVMQQLQLEVLCEELVIFVVVFQCVCDFGQLCDGVDVDMVVCIVSISLIGVLYSVMLELELFEIKCDGVEILDVIFSVFVKLGVFILGVVLMVLLIDDEVQCWLLVGFLDCMGFLGVGFVGWFYVVR